MTTPTERTAAVQKTRAFLEMLAHGEGNNVSQDIALRAETLLRHYPSDLELELTSAVYPTCWQMGK